MPVAKLQKVVSIK